MAIGDGTRISINVADVPVPMLGAVGRAIELAGFDGMFLGDHVVTMSIGSSEYPYAANPPTFRRDAPRPDPLLALANVAAVTERISLGTAVLVAPLRHPVLLARAAASLQELCGGRFVLGLGAGWLESEFVPLGVPFSQRGVYLDEMLDVLPRLLAGDVVDHAGAAYDIRPVELTPPSPVVPIFVGGHGRRALARAARADGWFGPPVDLATTLELSRALHDARRCCGTDDRAFTIVARLPAGADGDTVAEYRQHGFDELAISPFRSGIVDPSGSETELRDELHALAGRLLGASCASL
jgi:probable F420-dependent oxidoreductase